MPRRRSRGVILVLFLAASLSASCNDDGTEPSRPPKEVTSAKLSGTVRWLRDASPLPGVVVTVGDEQDTTDADGRYEILRIPRGTYTVRAEKPDYDPSAEQVTITSGEDPVILDFAMTYGPPTIDVSEAGVRYRGNDIGCRYDSQFCGIRVHDERGDDTITRVVAYSGYFNTNYYLEYKLGFDGDTWSGTFRFYLDPFGRPTTPRNLAAFDADGNITLLYSLTGGGSCLTLEPIRRSALLHRYRPGDASPYATEPLAPGDFHIPLGESARIEARSNYDPGLDVVATREKRRWSVPATAVEDEFVFTLFLYCTEAGEITLAAGRGQAVDEGTLPFTLYNLDSEQCSIRIGLSVQAVCGP